MRRWTYWLLGKLLFFIRRILHLILGVYYGGKGKKVPRVKNPLLMQSATELAKNIREQKLSSETVVSAYIQRIEEVEPYINATIDRPFEDALKEAKEADMLVKSGLYTAEQLQEIKPLLGVPFTVKSVICVKGLRYPFQYRFTDTGLADRDAPTITLLKKAGAILIATTNFGKHLQSDINGITCNPYDTNRISGGSSGGESALISAAGSVIGLGNDMMGSIRVPAHFTGIFAHKPSKGLVSSEGCPLVPYESRDYLYEGPMCRYAEDIVTTMRVLSSGCQEPVDFEHKVDFKNLKILHLRELNNPLTEPVDEDITQAINKAVSHFRTEYGCSTKQVNIHWLNDSVRCTMHHVIYNVDCNPDSKSRKDMKLWALGPFYQKSEHAHYESLVQRWNDEFDKMLDADTVLMMPTLPSTAPYPHEALLQFPSLCYTAVSNVTGMPSTQCPVGFTKSGMPMGMQIIGRKGNDSLTIGCAIELEKVFGGWRDPGI